MFCNFKLLLTSFTYEYTSDVVRFTRGYASDLRRAHMVVLERIRKTNPTQVLRVPHADAHDDADACWSARLAAG